MNKNLAWKNALVIAVVFLMFLYALPNIFGSDFALQISALDEEEISQTQVSDATKILKNNNVDYHFIGIKDSKVLIRFKDSSAQLKAQGLLKKHFDRSYVVALNIVPATPQWLDALGAKAMFLGLDLRGGVHFLLEVDMDEVVRNTIERYYFQVRTLLRTQRLYRSINYDNNNITVVFRNSQSKDEGEKQLRNILPEMIIADKGDDLSLVLSLSDATLLTLKRTTLKQNIMTLRNRVNELGVAEPIIQQQGLDRIVVQLPGVQDTARAKDILGAVATLEFRMVDEENNAEVALSSNVIPSDSRLYRFRDSRPLLLKKQVIATGENISNASSSVDSQSNSPMVSISLDSVGGQAMLETTKKYLHQRMAVVFIENKVETIRVNGEYQKKRSKEEYIINAATIQGVFSNRFQITGLESIKEARKLSLLLRAGSLSAPIEIIEERTIGPSLGQDNIDAGFISVIVGFILVLLFMLWRYKVFGLIANIALSLNLVIIVAVLSLLQATLTLPGIAGIVLTVGMAVDANVLIFERIKEELIKNDLQKAIHLGYERALLTISDAAITTFIAAVVLFGFGTGPIKGFAITLSIGIISSVFTAIIVSRLFINAIYGNRQPKQFHL